MSTTTFLLDGNIYDMLEADAEARALLEERIRTDTAAVVATPIVIDELNDSPFRGLPGWFPIAVERESVVVLGYARLGMARLDDGNVFAAHRGKSKRTKDAIIADSADSIAHIFVSEDRRCRHRLAEISTRCRAMTYGEFREWLFNMQS